ncbi:MAG: hypothetical protein WBO92_00115 [Candidatus Moraniibacteriota bacterium]
MTNPFETPPDQPPKPAGEKDPSQEPPKPGAAEEASVEAPAPSPEMPTDVEVMRTMSVPVPYTPEEMAAAKKRLDADYVEPEAIAPSPDEQIQKERADLENFRKVVELMDEFELRYPLAELHAVTHTTLAELVEHPVRKPANAALVHIRKAMALNTKRVPELDERYLRLSRAVGMYNSISKTVDHDRG